MVIQKHQSQTSQSSVALLTAAERSQLAECNAKISELERQVKDREATIKHDRLLIEQLEAGKDVSLFKRVQELTEDLR